MRGYRRLGWYRPRVIALLMTLGISLLLGTTAQATPQYDLRCEDCHRMPPLDSANGDRVPETGAFKGNHASHADAAAKSCVKCHGAGVLVYDASHRTKSILLQAGINGSATGSYSRPFLNQTSVPPNPLGTCSNVNCHFERTSPAWGSAPMSSPTDCNSCHGAQPSAGHPVTGSKHAAYYGTGTSSCIKCHTDHSAEAKPFAHATSVTHRAISVLFNQAPNNGGSYSGPTDDFLPSRTNTFGTCSGIYCHSDGTTKTGPFTVTTAPTWGGGTLGCGDCHGGPATLATGKHQAHVNNTGTLGTSHGCVDCHAKTASSDSAIAVTANHVNAFVEYSGAKAGKNYSGGTCSATYCHSSGKKGQAGMVATVEPAAPSWSGAAMGCNGCHGAKPMGTAGVAFNSVAGEPNYASSGLAAANSHQKHVGAAGAASCATCHSKTTVNGTTLIALNQHLNGLANYSSANGTFGRAANKSCSNNNCHSSNGKVPAVADAQWGTTLNCNGCHGGPVSLATNRMSTGAHAKHTNQASVIGDNLACAECHANTVSGDTALGTPGNHMNNFVDYSGAKAGKRSTVVGGTCSATYCHSSGKKGAVAATVEPAAPSWSGGLMGCNGCHGAKPSGAAGIEFDSTAGEPNYVSGLPGSDTANSHKKHVGSGGAATCSKCHSKTTANGTSIVAGSQHLDRFANYTSANGGFGKLAGKTCSNISCHSGNGRVAGVADAQWGATLNCNGCHGGPAALTTNILATGKHGAHINAPAEGGNYGCVECHAKTVSSDTQIADTLVHADTFVNYSGVKAGKSTTYAGGVCSATYCHSSGKKGQPGMAATVEPASPSWSGGALGCNGCHGARLMGTAGVAFTSVAGEPNYTSGSAGSPSANSHAKHVKSDGAVTCVLCHSATVDATGTAIVGNHTNKVADVQNGGGASFGYPGNKTCSNVSCHSGAGYTAANIVWGATADCKSCHGTLSAGHTRHVGTNAVWGSLPFYNFTANRSSGSDTDGVTKANYFFGCANCHPVTLASHINGSVEVEMNTSAGAGTLRKKNSAAGIIGSTGTGTVSCSNVYCHENVTTPQWNQTFTAAGRCSGCHENAPSTDSHAAHKVGIHYNNIFSGTSGLLPAAGAVGVNAGHGDPAQSTTIGCNICHYNTVKLPRNKYNSSCSTVACHGNTTGSNADSIGAARIGDLSFHVNGRNDVAFQPSAYMKSKAQVTDAAFVSYTGGLGGWNKTRTYKAGASSYDTSKNYLTITSYNNGSCSNISCHNGVTVHWVNDFGGAQDCTMCHTNL
uniref:Cytochrome C family protein n=1 Tax=Geobacter sp. (strain M21) TaxID=443144 RepID=C6E632_GEOSM